MKTELYAHYKAVLEAEQTERERLCNECKHINLLIKQKDTVIAALKASLAADDAASREQASALPFAQPVGLAAPPPNLIYAGISVRWALLSLMSDHAKTTLSTTEMAEALVAGGVRSGGERFPANVSAVVSDMKIRGELESAENNKYRITPKGREVWEGIRTRPQYNKRLLPLNAQR